MPMMTSLTKGDYKRAFELSEALMAAGKASGLRGVTVEALSFMGWAAWGLKEYGRFNSMCEEILIPDWENNLPPLRGTLFYVFGRIALSRGDYSTAQKYLKHFNQNAAIERFLSIQALGVLAAAAGQPRRAAALFGALDSGFGWLHNVMGPAERSEYEQALETSRAALGSQAFQAAWTGGAAMPREAMMAFAASG